jgi:hypothetical protein
LHPWASLRIIDSASHSYLLQCAGAQTFSYREDTDKIATSLDTEEGAEEGTAAGT